MARNSTYAPTFSRVDWCCMRWPQANDIPGKHDRHIFDAILNREPTPPVELNANVTGRPAENDRHRDRERSRASLSECILSALRTDLQDVREERVSRAVASRIASQASSATPPSGSRWAVASGARGHASTTAACQRHAHVSCRRIGGDCLPRRRIVRLFEILRAPRRQFRPRKVNRQMRPRRPSRTKRQRESRRRE